jgi:hypothetical protein
MLIQKSGLGSISVVPLKPPETRRFPFESKTISFDISNMAPPIDLAHIKLPVLVNFFKNISLSPLEVSINSPLLG